MAGLTSRLRRTTIAKRTKLQNIGHYTGARTTNENRPSNHTDLYLCPVLVDTDAVNVKHVIAVDASHYFKVTLDNFPF